MELVAIIEYSRTFQNLHLTISFDHFSYSAEFIQLISQSNDIHFG